MKILHLDTNHKLLINQLSDLDFINHEDYRSSKEEIEAKIKCEEKLVTTFFNILKMMPV